MTALMRLAGEQAGIVTRTQVLDHGFSDCWLKHQVAAHRWRRVHTGVYATFTGERCWAAQCSAALLRCGDSARGRHRPARMASQHARYRDVGD
jgi:hypothetical protein